MNESTTRTTKQFTGCASLAAVGVKVRELKLVEPIATRVNLAKQRTRRGRQLGAVLASSYEEIVVDRLFDGKTQLTRALQPLMQAAEETLQLDEDKRRRTIVRVDAGGGSLDDVNWLLARDYQVHCKDYSGQHAKRLAHSRHDWYVDQELPDSQFGWLTWA